MHEYWLADAASVVIEYLLPMITSLMQAEATAEQINNSKGIAVASSSHDTSHSTTARNGGISNNNTHALMLSASNGMMMRKLPAALR
jgi:hypothetical protein